jgi:hypothetical protein
MADPLEQFAMTFEPFESNEEPPPPPPLPKPKPKPNEGTVPKSGQTVAPTDVAGEMKRAREQAVQFGGEVTGVTDVRRVLSGETPWAEAIGAAIPGVLGGPEVKAAEKAAPAVKAGIRAFHGSPHDFPAFDISKIGTGEGAQAYGHGLYFAENPAVAGQYKESLSRFNYANRGEEFADSALKLHGGDRQSAIDYIRGELPKLTSDESKDANSAINLINSGWTFQPSGKTYEVNINADPEHFLDWDKPLSEQHPKVQQAISQLTQGKDPQAFGQSGSGLYNFVGAWNGRQDQNASDALRQAGIPGIRYLDQGSRMDPAAADLAGTISVLKMGLRKNPDDAALAARVATAEKQLAGMKSKQTYNYVVFDDKLIDIIKKYGIAGLIAGGASNWSPDQAKAGTKPQKEKQSTSMSPDGAAALGAGAY